MRIEKCCKNCGYVTVYSGHGKGKPDKYECINLMEVKANGVCDRWSKIVTPSEIMKRIDKEIKRIEKIEPKDFHLKDRPKYGQNYHVIGEENGTE